MTFVLARRLFLSCAAACVLAAACGKSGASLDITLYTPVREEQLPFDNVRLLRVNVTAPGLTRPPQIFDVAAGIGRITDLPLSRFVSVTVDGLAGADAAPISRGYAPPVDLLGGVAVTLPVLFAQVDRFATNVSIADGVRADLVDQRVGQSVTLLKDGRVLIAGGAIISAQGGVQSPLVAAELYDPATGLSASVPPMGFARAFHSATLLKDGRVLVSGGISLISGALSAVATAEVFDPATKAFRNTGGLTESRGRVSHTASLLPDGRVLLAGGWGEGGNGQRTILDSAELFDPASGRYSAAGNMRIARSSHTATLLFDGRVLLAGGRSPTGALASTELFNAAATPMFSDGPALPGEPRAGHAAVRLGSGFVLVVGGCRAPEPINARASAGTGSGCHAVDGATPPATTALSRVDLYDPGSGAVGQFVEGIVPPLQESRTDATLTLLPGDARVLVAGGLGQDGSSKALAELIEESPGPIYARRPVVGRMRVGRTFHGATRLASGVVLLCGGSARSGPLFNFSVLNAIELYVP